MGEQPHFVDAARKDWFDEGPLFEVPTVLFDALVQFSIFEYPAKLIYCFRSEGADAAGVHCLAAGSKPGGFTGSDIVGFALRSYFSVRREA